uniref:Uncharacterized protein n=1 Tax=Moniliophthora roreri TaxID=221103 RepID=A0A0W0FJG3_MONRR
MPDDVPIVSVSLANVAVESFLYGIFFVLDIGTIMLICFPLNDMTRTLMKESISRRIQITVKKPMFLGSIALFISITGHWICTVLRLFEAVVFSEKGPLAYYEDLSQDLYAIKTGFSEASLIITDSMLIYRLWMIWSRNYYVIIIPILTLIGLIVCGIGGTNDFAHYTPGQSVFSSVTQAWVISDGVFTLLTNMYSSTLIGYRIWRTERESRYSGAVRVGSGSNLSSVLVIFVESALLYTTWTTVCIATYAAESRVESINSDCWAVVAGISSCLINPEELRSDSTSSSSSNVLTQRHLTAIFTTDNQTAADFSMSSSSPHPAALRAGHSYNSEMTAIADEDGVMQSKTSSVVQPLPKGASMPSPTTPQYPPQPEPDSPPGTPNQRLLDDSNHVQFATYPSEEKRRNSGWEPTRAKGKYEHGKTWIPLPLRPWFWLTFVVILILLAIGLEVALHLSNKNNGFAVRGDPTRPQSGVWHYVYTLPPVIVAMFIVAMWTWTDIEIKKMQPYVDLVHGDSPPHRSLLLDYTRTNNFVVWIHALSNRHFTVFLASLMLLTSLSFQPLSAALLDVRNVWWSIPDASIPVRSVLGLNNSAVSGDLTSFLASAGFAGATALYDLPQPPFTNGMYTIMEFDFPDVTRNGTTIFANATAIKTEPGCQPVSVTSTPLGDGRWVNSLAQDGCGLTFNVARTGPSLFGVSVANCTSGNEVGVPLEKRPVVFWFFTYTTTPPSSSATICYPRFSLFNVAATIDLGSGNVTKVVEQGPLNGNFTSQAGDLQQLDGRAFNGIEFPAGNDSTITDRKTAIQLTMPAAIFQRAVESPEGVQGSFSANRFVGLSERVYTGYLSLLAKDVYFVPAQGDEQINLGIKTTVRRLFLSPVATHLLAAGLLAVSIVACCVHIVHRYERRNLRLAHEPGTIASAVSIGGSTHLSSLLNNGQSEEKDMREALGRKKFRIDPKTMKIVMEGEDGYEYASTPREGELMGRRKSVFEALQRGSRRLSVFNSGVGEGPKSPKSPRA